MDIFDEVDPQAELERTPAWKLTNDQIIELLERRASEHKVQKALKQLIKAFQLEASRSPHNAPGLQAAIGLAEFWLTHLHGGKLTEMERLQQPRLAGRPIEGSTFSRLREIVARLPFDQEFTNKEVLAMLDPSIKSDSHEAASLSHLLSKSKNIFKRGRGRYVKRNI